ncbi:hypothetical protein HYH02_010546 [Chlamydomonas schloesseri]|uniref:Uncharacterized protein n=1 Tax=Chlamydomonas schloesseri TaxID=2026947 RepID=A0A835W457_9CHLO|nr:hypothetical protein HYH02_010546 [Chlamydomonas schloesseri]|eukprot:KAG2439917.1 hypothetical protein HYH02_010546 [Chlamydomonas schloesseri]
MRWPAPRASQATGASAARRLRRTFVAVKRRSEEDGDGPSTSGRRGPDVPQQYQQRQQQPSNPDLLFEQSRWRWPAFRESGAPPPPPPPPPFPGPAGKTVSNRRGPERAGGATPPPPPPPPPFPLPRSSPAAGGGTASGRGSGGAAAGGLPPPPAPPPPPRWADRLLRDDAELRDLLTKNPELWGELQRRAGKQGERGYVPPPGPPDASADPATYDRQVQEWLRYRRKVGGAGSGGGGGGLLGGGGGPGSAARQDDEVVSLALLYLAAAVPLLAFALASGGN